jgi:hypothetical protein
MLQPDLDLDSLHPCLNLERHAQIRSPAFASIDDKWQREKSRLLMLQTSYHSVFEDMDLEPAGYSLKIDSSTFSWFV